MLLCAANAQIAHRLAAFRIYVRVYRTHPEALAAVRTARPRWAHARLTGSPVVELNRAIAVAEAAGTEAGLSLVDRLELDGYQYFHSTRADLLRRLGRADEARTEYERALELAHTEPERRFLQRRLAEVGT